MGYVFRYNSTTRGRTPKRTTPSDSAHRIGPSTLSKDVLTVEEGVYGWRFKNRKIGNVFRHTSTTRGRTAKRRAALDSAHRIGVSTLSRGVLNVDEGVCGSWFKNRRIGNVFASASRSSGRTGTWRAVLDSAHRIGVSTLSRGVLNIDEGACGWRFKNRRIGNIFHYPGRRSRDTAKRMIRLDSARQIGLCTIWRGVLTQDEGVCG